MSFTIGEDQLPSFKAVLPNEEFYGMIAEIDAADLLSRNECT